MTIGTKVKFNYKDKLGMQKQITLTLSNNIIDDSVMSDESVYARFSSLNRRMNLSTLLNNGYIFAARNLLKVAPDATDINLYEEGERQTSSGDDAAGGILILAVLAFIVAVICFPLLVILGMHNKLFLKGFYNKYEDAKFKTFTKNYTYIGIGLYALVALLVIIDAIFKLYVLTGPAFGLLFVGGIAYFVLSLLYIKKNFAPEGEKIDIIKTLKEGFKKKEKKDNKD